MTRTAKLLIASLAAAIVTGPASAAPIATRYACSASRELTVERDRSTAHVNLAGRTYNLQRKRSSIGAKYLSSNAALIIDGESAVFVAEGHLDLGTCMRGVPLASSQ